MPDQAPQSRLLDEQEFTKLEDALIAQAPAGLSEQDFERWIGPRLEQAVAEREYGPAQPEGGSVGRFIGSAASMLNPIEMVKGAYQAVRHPIDTVTGMAGASAEQFGKGVDALGQGNVTEAAGRFGASIPVVGPVLGAVGDQIGSGDIAGGMGSLAGLAAPFGAAKALKGARAAIPAGARERAAGALQRGAESRVVDVMAPKVGPNKTRFGGDAQRVAGDVVKELKAEGAPFSREGLQQQVGAKLIEAEQGLDAANDSRLAARTFPTQPIIQDLMAKRRALTAEGVDASRTVREASAPSPKAVEAHGQALESHGAATADLAARERAFMLRWLADDLDEVTYSSGTMTKKARDAAERDYLPGDSEASRHGIGVMSARTPGTPVYQVIDPFVKGAYHVKAKRLRDAAEAMAAGKDVPPRIAALADAYMEGFAGDRFDFTRLKAETVDKLGIRPKDLKAPMTMPKLDRDPGVAARYFGEDRVRMDVPEASVAMDPLRPDAPSPSFRAVPLGADVVPGPNAPRVAVIDQAIKELKALGPVARYEPIRRIRQAYDGPAKAVYSPSMTQDFLKAQGGKYGAADVTGVLRDSLAKFDPATAEANAPYSLWRKAHDVLEATAEVERTRPTRGRQIAARVLATFGGAQAGGPAGAALGFALAPLFEVAAGTTPKLQTARIMSKLADAIRRGDLGQVNSLTSQLSTAAKKAAPAAVQATNPTGSQSPAPAGSPP